MSSVIKLPKPDPLSTGNAASVVASTGRVVGSGNSAVLVPVVVASGGAAVVVPVVDSDPSVEVAVLLEIVVSEGVARVPVDVTGLDHGPPDTPHEHGQRPRMVLYGGNSGLSHENRGGPNVAQAGSS